MREVKQISIKNRTYYFYNDMINPKDFESNLSKNRQKSITKRLMFTTMDASQLKKIEDYESIYSINPLYLLVNLASGHIEEKSQNRYLIFDDSVDEIKEVFKKYTDVWDGIKNKTKSINGGKENDYGKDYMKIKSNSDDDLQLNEPLKFHAMTIILR